MKNPFSRIFRRDKIGEEGHWLSKLISKVMMTSAGVNVTADNAMKVAAVYACIEVIAETIASLPLIFFERVGEGKKPATTHPLYFLLHDSPNDFQTSFEWREGIVTHLNLRGNAYNYMQGNGKYPDQLVPFSPGNMEVVRENSSLIYRYKHPDGKTENFPPEKIWHLKTMAISSGFNNNSPEGLMGVSRITLAKESIGLAMAADEYGGRYFANNATVGLNFQYPGKLTDNAKEFLKASFAEYGKLENKFKTIITEQGGKIEQIGMSNEDSQFLQSRQFQIEEIARIFRVPPILIGHPTKTMTYATAEQLFLAFGKFTILPWCRRIESSANRNLIPEKERGKFFFEFNIDGLLRADMKTRYESYGIARQWGFKNVDEIRKLENDDPLPDGKGQIYLEPINMKEAGQKTAPPPNKGNGEDKEEEENATTQAQGG